MAAIVSEVRAYILKPTQIRLIFSGGRERMPYFPVQVSNIELKPGITNGGIVPFPSKWDFQNQTSVSAIVSIYGVDDKEICAIEIKSERTEGQQEAKTFVEYSIVDYAFEFGASLLRTGDVGADLPSGNFAFGLSMYIFSGVHHGFNLGLGVEGVGDQGDAVLRPVSNGFSAGSMYTLWLSAGYSYRQHLTRRAQLVYDIDIGSQSYRASQASANSSMRFSESFLLTHKLSLDYMFGTLNGRIPMENSVGLSLFQGWITGGQIGTRSTAGTFLGAAARYKFGF